jgi:hypothetical protein
MEVHFDTWNELTRVFNGYETLETGRRFNRAGGELYEVKEEIAKGVENPEFEYAEFGEVELRPTEPGKWRVTRVRIVYARIMAAKVCEHT